LLFCLNLAVQTIKRRPPNFVRQFVVKDLSLARNPSIILYPDQPLPADLDKASSKNAFPACDASAYSSVVCRRPLANSLRVPGITASAQGLVRYPVQRYTRVRFRAR
jgi:hypothetical protein